MHAEQLQIKELLFIHAEYQIDFFSEKFQMQERSSV